MQNKFTLRKAERKQAKLKIGLFGPSGAGKTMSALKMARGMAEWDKIAVIDTENNSADLYSHLGDYNVLNIEAPFTPEKYMEAIKACADEGMEVVIIDSVTHEWAGTGGILEMVDDLGKAYKNSMQVWAKLTPRHNRFITSILECPAHVICCGRSKQDYVMNQVEKNGKTINVPEKVGLKAVTREGFDYEMTISFDIAINHYADTSKDRTGIFMGRPGFVINEETGKEIVEWNKSGVVDVGAQKKEIMRQLKRIGFNVNSLTKEELEGFIVDLTKLPLVEKNFEKIITKLRATDSIPEEEIKQDKEKKEINNHITKEADNKKKDEKIKNFELKIIRDLAKAKFSDPSDESIKKFISMYGVECENLEDINAEHAKVAIKLLENHTGESSENNENKDKDREEVDD